MMADNEQLARIKAMATKKYGYSLWNDWREEHIDVEIDLVNADLSGVNFTFFNLAGADLRNALLKNALLKNADLTLANLSNADFTGAHLNDASLRGANLRGAIFTRAVFSHIKVDGALVDDETFVGIDISRISGWESLRYPEPIIPIPIPTYTTVATATIFISYSRTDTSFVDILDASLRSIGFDTWVDRGHLQGGQQWLREIEAAIDTCATLLVVLSPDAVQSNYVGAEYLYAYQQKKTVIPLDYHACKIPMLLNTLQIIDFRTTPYEQAIQYLVKAIQSHKSK